MTSILRQPTTTDGDQDLVGRLGTEIEAAVDRWSIGQLGLIDLVDAGITLDLDASVDLDRAERDLLDALANTPDVLAEPRPEIVASGLDGSQVSVAVLVWHTPELWVERRVRDHMIGTILRTLDDSDVGLADATVLVGPP